MQKEEADSSVKVLTDAGYTFTKATSEEEYARGRRHEAVLGRMGQVAPGPEVTEALTKVRAAARTIDRWRKPRPGPRAWVCARSRKALSNGPARSPASRRWSMLVVIGTDILTRSLLNFSFEISR